MNTRFAWFVKGIDIEIAEKLSHWPREWDEIALEALYATGLSPWDSDPPEEIEVYDLPAEALEEYGIRTLSPVLLLFILRDAGMAMLASPGAFLED